MTPPTQTLRDVVRAAVLSSANAVPYDRYIDHLTARLAEAGVLLPPPFPTPAPVSPPKAAAQAIIESLQRHGWNVWTGNADVDRAALAGLTAALDALEVDASWGARCRDVDGHAIYLSRITLAALRHTLTEEGT